MQDLIYKDVGMYENRICKNSEVHKPSFGLC